MQSVKSINHLVAALLVVVLAGCSEHDPRYNIPTQKWGEVVIEIQTRPTPMTVGMNEFMVLATTERGRPLPSYIISLRLDQDKPWQQAIQDGFSGVYRKAALIPAGATTVYIQMRKKKTGEMAEFNFPITLVE